MSAEPATRVQVGQHGAWHHLLVEGALDIAGLGPFRDAVSDVVGLVRQAEAAHHGDAEEQAHTSGRVVIDLLGVGFLDSAGIGALVVAQREVIAAGGSLVVAASLPAYRVLELTGLDAVLGCRRSLPAALASVPQGQGPPDRTTSGA